MKILVTPTSFTPDTQSPAMEKLKSFCPDLVFNPAGRPLTQEELIPLLAGCQGYLAGLDYITETALDAATDLIVISRYGAGVDRVDLKAAARRNIAVANTPGVNAQAVAELAFGLVLCCARKIPYLDKQTRNNCWTRNMGMELAGKTMGIVGLGAIGRRLAKMAQGTGMHVIAYDPYLPPQQAEELHISLVPLEDLMRTSDVISLHLPLNEQTRHLFNAQTMAALKPGVILVNTSRGGLIDEAAALPLLKSGHIGGLGLDVYENEPPENSPLFPFEQVVVTPHTGAHTRQAVANMAEMAVDNLIALLTGQACPYTLQAGS